MFGQEAYWGYVREKAYWSLLEDWSIKEAEYSKLWRTCVSNHIEWKRERTRTQKPQFTSWVPWALRRVINSQRLFHVTTLKFSVGNTHLLQALLRHVFVLMHIHIRISNLRISHLIHHRWAMESYISCCSSRTWHRFSLQCLEFKSNPFILAGIYEWEFAKSAWWRLSTCVWCRQTWCLDKLGKLDLAITESGINWLVF